MHPLAVCEAAVFWTDNAAPVGATWIELGQLTVSESRSQRYGTQMNRMTPPCHDDRMKRRHAPTTAPTRRQRFVIFDIDQPNLVHTRLDCNEHVGLIDVVDQWFGGPCDDPDVVEAVAFRHGLIADADLVQRGTPCAHCTLVAAPLWRAAA
jgi:hypothetical protein